MRVKPKSFSEHIVAAANLTLQLVFLLHALQIIPRRKPEPTIGQRHRMSPYDIEEVKYLYECGKRTYCSQ